MLFGAGSLALLDGGGIAVVGSRDVDRAGAEFAGQVGNRASRSGKTVISGAARGVDRIAMEAALAADRSAVGILAHGMATWLREPGLRHDIDEGRLTFVSPNRPGTAYEARHLMARNKLIYALSDFAVVAASDAGKGGTWSGALENLKHGWVPLFVRSAPDMPTGNRELIERGAIPLTHDDLDGADLGQVLAELQAAHTPTPKPGAKFRPNPDQRSMFPNDEPPAGG
ncbi:MAG: DNA-processing protein DprA [Thermomicrobiales bacterium]